MSTYEVKQIIDGQPCFEKPLATILSDLKLGGALQTLTPLEYITTQQRAWWKGVLLLALAKDSGDSREYWETKLKLSVMPDEFMPYPVSIRNKPVLVIPSITILSKHKMSLLIEGSVAKCHEFGLTWVTLPDKELRTR